MYHFGIFMSNQVAKQSSIRAERHFICPDTWPECVDAQYRPMSFISTSSFRPLLAHPSLAFQEGVKTGTIQWLLHFNLFTAAETDQQTCNIYYTCANCANRAPRRSSWQIIHQRGNCVTVTLHSTVVASEFKSGTSSSSNHCKQCTSARLNK